MNGPPKREQRPGGETEALEVSFGGDESSVDPSVAPARHLDVGVA